MNTVRFKILHHIGVLKTEQNGWTRELNIVSWNDGDPKFDIRSWDETHERMSRGITLTQLETDKLSYLLSHNAMRIGEGGVSKVGEDVQ